MSKHDHDLRSDFSADAQWLQRLKVEGAEFHSLADRYHALADLIHRIEFGSEPASAARLEALKSERLDILDEAAALVPVRKAT